MPTLDDQFYGVYERALQEAHKINCSQAELADGLQLVAEELLTAADAAQCLSRRHDEEDDDHGSG